MADGGGGRTVAKNTLVLSAMRVAAPAFSLLLVLVVSRILGEDGVGRFSLAYTFLYLGSALAPLGLQTVITRDGSRDRDQLERLVGNALTLGTISAVFFTVLLAGIAFGLDYDGGTRVAILVLTLAIVPATLGLFLEAAVVALERTEYMAAATAVEHLVKIGVGVFVLWAGFGLEAALLAAVAGRYIASWVTVSLLSRAGVSVRWRFDRERLAALLKLAPTFLLISLFATLYWRIDILMLSKFRSIGDVGQYGASFRMFSVAMVVPQALGLALYPRLSAASRDPDELTRLSRHAMRYLFALTVPIALITGLFAEEILGLLYGEPFRGSANTLRLLIIALIPYGIVRYYAYVLVAVDRQKIDLAFNIALSVVNVGLNLALIPVYGHVGAAAATLTSIVLYASAQTVYVGRTLPASASALRLPVAVVAAAAATWLGVWALRRFHFLPALVAAPAIYLAVLAVGRFFTDELGRKLAPGEIVPFARRFFAGRDAS